MGKNQHITPNGKGSWQLKGAGNSKATKYFDTQQKQLHTVYKLLKTNILSY